MNVHSFAPPGPLRTFRRLHRALLVIVVVLVSLLLASACVTKYPLRMRGMQLDPDEVLQDGSAVSVGKVPEVKKVANDDVVELKLEYLLKQRGYQVADAGDASFILLYRTETTPISGRSTHTSGARGSTGGMTITQGSGNYERVIYLHVIRSGPFLRDGTEEVLWSGSAVLPKVPSTSPRFEDLLLVGAFNHFNEDTGAIITEHVRFSDPLAKALHYLDPVTQK